MNVSSFLRNIFLFAFVLVAASSISYAQTNPELLHFRSEVAGQTIAFHWSVSEQNVVQSYGLERAGTDMKFKMVGTASAQSNEATYCLTDKNPLVGVAFYRLKVIDQTGNIVYGKVVSHRIDVAVEVGR